MSSSTFVSVQENDFDITKEYQRLLIPNETGAIVTFVGRVRDFPSPNSSDSSTLDSSTLDSSTQDNSMTIQHYPGMTERVLESIINQALNRWPILACSVIHRVGTLKTDDQIVYVGVSSAHRKDAFAANEYIIDILKSEAPFWKKEGDNWVDAKDSDQTAADAWLTKT